MNRFNGSNMPPRRLNVLQPKRKDIFDEVAENDVFSRVETEESAVDQVAQGVSSIVNQLDLRSDTGESDRKVKAAFENLVKEMKNRERNRETESLKSQIQELIRAEIAKIKPVQNVIERQVEQVVKHVYEPVHLPPPPAKETIIKEKPQIIRETKVELPAGYVKKEDFDALKKKIEDLTKTLEETKRMAETPLFIPSGPGGSGVIGIPPPEAASEADVLTVTQGKAKWKPPTGGGGGGNGLSGYTVTNGSETKSFDAQDVTIDELARVVGSIITDLQA